MYLNNVGIRKAAKLLGCSSSLLVRWVRQFAANLRRDLSKVADDLASTSVPEVIEMDEIYTRVKKRGLRVPVWVSYSRRRGKVVAHTIGASSNYAIELYNLTKRAVGNISRICISYIISLHFFILIIKKIDINSK